MRGRKKAINYKEIGLLPSSKLSNLVYFVAEGK